MHLIASRVSDVTVRVVGVRDHRGALGIRGRSVFVKDDERGGRVIEDQADKELALTG
ncbi:hypothetical protein [Microbacterium lacticum]|uniref:hypothetical protein n=1 Tax=Microbacterium lacticum TaxID=33885 RepID=UPI001F585F4E|nr:hypothetical protein [Microbacterium lacticum]